MRQGKSGCNKYTVLYPSFLYAFSESATTLINSIRDTEPQPWLQ